MTYEIPRNNTVDELHASNEDQVGHEDIEEVGSLRCCGRILGPDVLGDFEEGGVGFEGLWAGRQGGWPGRGTLRCHFSFGILSRGVVVYMVIKR